MRKLRTTLADGNIYLLTTLTLKEQAIATKLEKLPKKEQKVIDELEAKQDAGEKISDKDSEKFVELQQKQIRNLLKIMAMSLSKNHEEFKVTEKNTEEKIIDNIENLIDIRDMKRYTNFAILGTLPIDDEDDYEVEEIIDLVVEEPNE